MKPGCLKCGSALLRLREGVMHYSWNCPNGCVPVVDTGVALSDQIEPFERVGINNGQLTTSLFTRPIHGEHLPGAKVYMPFILWHFIECSWGACYNSIYFNVLVPYLDNVPALDYVLRSPVVQGTLAIVDGVPKPKMYVELYLRLRGVKSAAIQQYLTNTFDQCELEKFPRKSSIRATDAGAVTAIPGHQDADASIGC